MTEDTSRFSLPWTVVETENSFLVKDASGMILSRTKFRLDGTVAKTGTLSKGEAMQIAFNMVKVAKTLVPLITADANVGPSG